MAGSVPLRAIGILTIALPCQAQDVATDDTVEEIVVTGSRIKRRDFVTPTPLTTVNADDIAFSGQPTVEETLNQMPQVLPHIGRTSNNPSAGNNPGVGGAEVDLRGLGPNRSLVLLNGRRLSPSSTDNRVDLNNIPQFLVERVEIITGGTSTVYGSDAIAGVVNFITRDDFSGFSIEVGASMAEPGDAEVYDFNAAWGHNLAGGRGNLTIYANLVERKSLLAAEREISRVPYLDDWQGNIVETGSAATPGGYVFFPLADLGDGPVETTFDADGVPIEFTWPDDAYNYAPVNYLQTPLRRAAAGVMGRYGLWDRFEGYVEASFVRNEPEQNHASVPAFAFTEVNFDNPMLTPEAQQVFADNYACGPNLACFWIGKRLLEMGPRRVEHELDYARLVAGIQGELTAGWDIDGWVTYTSSKSTVLQRNDVSENRLLQGLLVDPATNQCYDPTGGCVPIDIFGENRLSPSAIEFIRYPAFVTRTERTQKLASIFVTGSPVETWAGPLDTAIGFEWRSDETFFKADDALFTGDALGYNAVSPVAGTEEVAEVYAEAVIPLASNRSWARYLGLEIGGRYSEHKRAGGVWTYKAGGEWQPLDGLRFRAMHQRSVRAPNSGELFEEQRIEDGAFVVFDANEDPCSASQDPVGNGVVEKCVLQGLPETQIGTFEATFFYPMEWISGGNPDLEPETGNTWTVGAVISPDEWPNWTLTVDYFSLDVTDTIGEIDAALICFDPINTGHVFCDNIQRDTTGNVVQVTQLTSNRGLMETRGIDTQVQYAAELPDYLTLGNQPADVSVNVYWTHMIDNDEQENPATEVLPCAGYFGWPCDTDARVGVYSEDRITANVHYTSGALGLHLTWRWIAGSDNAAPHRSAIFGVPDPDLAIPSIGDEHYLDVGLAYEFGDHFLTRVGVNNLLDNDPPLMADAVREFNTYAGLYDIFGRSYFVTLTAHF